MWPSRCTEEVTLNSNADLWSANVYKPAKRTFAVAFNGVRDNPWLILDLYIFLQTNGQFPALTVSRETILQQNGF